MMKSITAVIVVGPLFVNSAVGSVKMMIIEFFNPP
jgi:hypothetical protein